MLACSNVTLPSQKAKTTGRLPWFPISGSVNVVLIFTAIDSLRLSINGVFLPEGDFYILHFPKICPHRPRKPYYISHLSGNSKQFFSWENMNPEYFFPRNFFIPCPVIDPRSSLSRVRFGGGGICGRFFFSQVSAT